MSTTKYIVNNVTGQTINGQSVLPTYKVYTALLTQSGGDNPIGFSDLPLTKGVTYLILDASNGDFSNVGAPNNNIGTYFVATESTMPNSFGGATLEYNTGAPVVTVLENTIGNIWFTYVGEGGYSVESSDLFVNNKTYLNIGTSQEILSLNRFDREFSSRLYVYTYDTTFNFSNDLLSNTPIEIRVYN